MQSLVAEFQAETGRDIELDASGSLQARFAIEEGHCNLALVARPMTEEIDGDGIQTFPFLIDVGIVVVHRSNPLSTLTLAEVAGIFTTVGGGYASWSDLRDLSAAALGPFDRLLVPARNSLAFQYLRQRSAAGSDFRPSVKRRESNAELFASIESSVGSIGLFRGLIPSGAERVKVLYLSDSERERALSPTAENVFFGDYPLCVPYDLVIRRAELSDVERRFLEFLMRDSSTEIIAEAGFYAAPPAERRGFLMQVGRN